MNDLSERGATISPCGRYRYRLWRRVADGDRRCLFVMLNPSTADALDDDPTIKRCVGFVRSWGYHVLDVVNLFAVRSTDPDQVLRLPFPVGPDNNTHILSAARCADLIVCAWGGHKAVKTRGRAVKILLQEAGFKLNHLGLANGGHPRHPLYLPASMQPQPWE